MNQQLLQINFQFDIAPRDFEKKASTVAEHFADIPGLQWKIWLVNREKREGGGIYLFKDEESAEAYLVSILFKSIKESPIFKNVSVKQSGVMTDASTITYAPLADISVVL